MPKPRRREPSGRRRAERRSGPRKDQPPPPLTSEEKAYARLFAALDADTSEPAHLVCLPPLFVDHHATQAGFPLQRCLDDCSTLVHAYAHLGLRAQVRVAELTITDARDGSTTVHGTLEPRWRGDVFHGHTVVWLPDTGHLVDPTPDQFEPLAALDQGPVVAAVARASHTGTGPTGASVRREHLLLAYALAPPEATGPVMDHPMMTATGPEGDHARHGHNVAAAIVALLADRLPPAPGPPHSPRPGGCPGPGRSRPPDDHHSRRGPAVRGVRAHRRTSSCPPGPNARGRRRPHGRRVRDLPQGEPARSLNPRVERRIGRAG
ncbi:hypothetical protein ACIRL2_45190 [Embleya sp. NPDC127516]|uniref:hypothetical protein n=1 Tax=Embleya sp. NPDC127516 TaxID=3363990 RepID=UPI0038041BDB